VDDFSMASAVTKAHSGNDARVINALTFDIEDWFHLLDMDAVADPDSWGAFPTIVERETHHIVELLGEYGVRATFFVLGWVAERYPGLAKMIVEAGHEVGSHSYWHRKADQLTPKAFHDDLCRSLRVLEDQTGRAIRGYRAPGFSLTAEMGWAYDILLDQGVRYDASIVAAGFESGFLCGTSGVTPMVRADSGRRLPSIRLGGVHVGPVFVRFIGGGYLRLLPSPLIQAGVQHVNRQGKRVVVYLHPRDFAIDCPRVPMSARRRFMSYMGAHTTEPKVRMMVEQFQFGSCADALGMGPW
jgi:polysaccharide deacetylase family protein (PEP-CTERM system associated)